MAAPDGPFLLAFGEDHLPGVRARLVKNALQRGGGRIQPASQLLAVAVLVDDKFARDAAFHGGRGNGVGHRLDQARIERHRDDIVRAVTQTAAGIGRVHLVRHILPRQLGQRFGGGDLHRVVDGRCPDIERAPEDVGEAQHIVDLVLVVGPAGCDDGVGADRLDFLGRDFRVRIGQREDDGPGAHPLDHIPGECALDRQADRHVGAVERVFERARFGDRRMGRLPLVHALLAALIDDAAGIAHDHVIGRHAHRLDKFGAGNARGAGAVDHDLGVPNRSAGQVERIDQAGRHDNRGAVLVVVEHRNIQEFA